MQAADPTPRREILPISAFPQVQELLQRGWVIAVSLAKEMKEPPCAIALGSSLFVVIASVLVIFADPNRIRAHAPPPPTRIQILQAEETAKEFSTTPPSERVTSPAVR